MKRIILVISMILFSILAYQYFKSSPDTAQISNPPLEKPSSKKLFLGKRKQSPLILVTGPKITDRCLELTQELEKIDFNLDVKDWVNEIDFSLLDQCPNGDLKNKFTEIKESCLGKVKEVCPMHLVMLRSFLRTQGINDAEDRDMLVDLILSEFYKPEPDFRKMNSFAEKMMGLEPEHEMFQKIWASSKLIGGLQDKFSFNHYAEDILSTVDESIWTDPQMEVIHMALETNLEPLAVENFARQTKNDEVLGWSLWKQGRNTEALAALDRAIAKNPKDEYLKDQRKRLMKNPKDPMAYQGRFSLGFNTQDIFN